MRRAASVPLRVVGNMANRNNHYEAAFEEYLRAQGIPYLAVDEARRTLMANGRSIKSLDYVVASSGPVTWLVDVKGRRFPSGDEHKQYWKNWSPREDLHSLAEWEKLFGESFRGLLVFAYNVVGSRAPLPPQQLFVFREALYGFVAMELAEYAALARPISPSWDTVAVPGEEFRRRARPVQWFLFAGRTLENEQATGPENGR